MCRPNTENNNVVAADDASADQPCNVVIAGAGPAGLLLTALLMQRNQELPEPLYRVTLIDGRQDFSQFSTDELKKSFRSWMLGLAGHGCNALRTCHGLYNEYCKDVGIEIDTLSIHFGSKEFAQSATPEEMKASDNENFIVDRNFIVAAIARFVADAKGKPENINTCQTLYQHKIMYVDYENRRILVRSGLTDDNDREFYLPYDLLVGCDGVRSVVREAMVKRHSTFEMDVGDIFQSFKAVHVERPDNVKEASMHLLPDCFPHMQGIALPETGNMLNMTIGAPRHLFDQIPSELKSSDIKVVADYVRKAFQAFELTDYDEFAKQWVNQPWNRTGQVHCNYYHSNDINVVLMGDAAHATSPSIGMGMNTALRDASIFYQLLHEHKDNIEQVLPAFSQMRVKEGNSLTDLAMHLYCMDTKQQAFETIHVIVRVTLHKFLPWLVADHPQNMIGRVKFNLSDVYEQASRLGILQKHRRINDTIRLSYFEQTTGMVTKKSTSLQRFGRLQLSTSVLVVALLVFLQPFWKPKMAAAVSESSMPSFFQRYETYPPYCADPKEMASRTIPPLPPQDYITNSSISQATRLVHVSAIIRHGSRTPAHPNRCWSGYWDEPEGIWDCNLTTMLASQPDGDGMFLVKKVYDAFRGDGVDSPYKNNLNGTCQEGQLIEQGYAQQDFNGRILRDAYIYDGNNENQDPRLRLFDTSRTGFYPFDESHLRYRSDDDQRTLASGQILLSSMFQAELEAYRNSEGSNPIIAHHTADRHVDILSPKMDCPSHTEAKRRSLESDEYKEFVNSSESLVVRQLLQKELGLSNPEDSILDCLMTAICTDRTLPRVLDDFGKEEENDDFTNVYGSNRFKRVVDYLIQNQTVTLRYNDSQWSKVVMAPFWSEIMDFIMPVLLDDNNQAAVKFALYSGHDSTLSPLMASLSPKLWNETDFPWYASMMIIEIHESRSEQNSERPEHYFRLIYNGKVLTWLIEGCPQYYHLCEVSVLTNRVLAFATRKNGGCGDTNSVGVLDAGTENPSAAGTNLYATFKESAVQHPKAALLVSMMISFSLCSLLTLAIMAWFHRRPLRKQRDQSELILGTDVNSSEFGIEEPAVVIE